IIISFESIAQFLVKCKNNEFNSTAIIVYPIVFRLENLYPMINNKPFKIKFIKPGDEPYKYNKILVIPVTRPSPKSFPITNTLIPTAKINDPNTIKDKS